MSERQGSQKRLQAGNVLFREGDQGHEAYLVEGGAIEIFVERADGARVLARLGPDEMFGEMALIGDSRRSAGARAIADTTLTVITRETLDDQLERASPLLRHLLNLAVARWRDTLRLVASGAPEDSSSLREIKASRVAQVGEPDDRDIAVRRLRMEQMLKDAMANNELELFYQPIVSLDNRQIAGFEALVRWRHDGKLVSPAQFIWVIEDSPLVLEFGRWTVREAARGLQRFQTIHRPVEKLDPLFCSVNLSVRQLRDDALCPTIESSLAESQLNPEQLRLEITESAILNNFESALMLLERCRGLGCKLIVDDFGTGYSSLAYLHRLPVDGLKIDRSFIQETSVTERGRRIVHAIGRLATDLGMYAVAEGIETSAHEALCNDMSLRYGQGYLFGRPESFDEASNRLAGRTN